MFRKVLTVLSLAICFITFQSFANTIDFKRYTLEPYSGFTTATLDSKGQSEASYSMHYSFFEMTIDKVYYIYDKKNTSKVLYKFVSNFMGPSSLYKKLDGDKYEKVLSFEPVRSVKNFFSFKGKEEVIKARELGYFYIYNILDKKNNIIAHLYYQKRNTMNHFNSFYDYTGGFELRTPDNESILIKAYQPSYEYYTMQLKVAPNVSKELLLAVSNFMVPTTERYDRFSDIIDTLNSFES